MIQKKCVLCLAVLLLLIGSSAIMAEESRLDLNDITILYPLPSSQEDVDGLISIAELNQPSGEAVFGLTDFQSILNIIEDKAAVSDVQVVLPSDLKEIANWKIAGIRIDPSAPGSSRQVIDVFGSNPQIRLVLQPVTASNTITVHDFAMHLIYDYRLGQEPPDQGHVPRGIPDKQKFQIILDDLLTLKSACEMTIATTAVPLNVHPCLHSDRSDFFHIGLQTFLSKHLDPAKMNSGAIMGLPAPSPEPWVFMSFTRDQDRSFVVFPGPGLGPLTAPKPAQMLTFLHPTNVLPNPSPTNRQAHSSSLIEQPETRRGVSTAVLFESDDLSALAPVGTDDSGKVVFDDEASLGDIADIVANPLFSHFFNTDCVSCHTETTRRSILSIPPGRFAFEMPDDTQSLDESVVPGNNWNVRNLGWFRSNSTITQRTANESAEAIEFIREEYFRE